jgi:hypothetical protein
MYVWMSALSSKKTTGQIDVKFGALFQEFELGMYVKFHTPPLPPCSLLTPNHFFKVLR